MEFLLARFFTKNHDIFWIQSMTVRQKVPNPYFLVLENLVKTPVNVLDFKNPTIFNIIIPWLNGAMGQMTQQPSSDVPSIIFFIIFYRLKELKTLYFYFCKIRRKLENRLKQFLQRMWKKNNAWNIRCLFDESFVPTTHWPSDPVYYIDDCQISKWFWPHCKS